MLLLHLIIPHDSAPFVLTFINTKGAEVSALLSGKIDKYEYLTGEEILPPDQREVIEQAKFGYVHLGKSFQKQTKTTENQEQKQIKALEENGKQLIKSSGEKYL